MKKKIVLDTDVAVGRGCEDLPGLKGGELLTEVELAQKLRVSQRTIQRWVKARRIPYYRFGEIVRFRWRQVYEELAKQVCFVQAEGEAAQNSKGTAPRV